MVTGDGWMGTGAASITGIRSARVAVIGTGRTGRLVRRPHARAGARDRAGTNTVRAATGLAGVGHAVAGIASTLARTVAVIGAGS